MNEQDKREIGEIVAAAIVQHGGCPHGVNAATAHELIDFATTWRHCKRTAIGAFIVTLIGAAGTAIWAGVKALAHVGTPLFLQWNGNGTRQRPPRKNSRRQDDL